MKKLLLIFSLLLGVNGFAQQQDSMHKTTGYASLQFGLGFPFGEFAASNTGAALKGHANNGIQLCANWAMPLLSKHVGIAAGYTFFNNRFNYESFPPKYHTILLYFGDGGLNYMGNAITAGLLLTAASYNVSFDLETKAGLLMLDYPGAGVVTGGVSNPPGLEYASGTAYGLIVDVRGQIRFELDGKIGLLFYADFLVADPACNISTNPYNVSNPASTVHSDIPVLLFTAGTGLFYRIGK